MIEMPANSFQSHGVNCNPLFSPPGLENARKRNKKPNHSIFRQFKKNPLFYSLVIFSIFISNLLLFILLVGRPRTIYLTKFTFDESIKFITKKNDLTFTLFGHCIDEQCTTFSFINDFGKSMFIITYLPYSFTFINTFHIF